MDDVDDAYLVARAPVAVPGRLRRTGNRHAALAYRVALRIVGDHHDAEDVAQESMVAAWQNLSPVPRRGTVHDLIVPHRHPAGTEPDRAAHAGELSRFLGDVPDPVPGPELLAQWDLAVDAVTDAIRALPPAQRVVVVLHHFEDLPYAEVAAITGSTVPAVRSHLFRARRTLGAALQVWR